MTSSPSDQKWLIDPHQPNNYVTEFVREKTYVGIDFGTSSTVVSIITVDDEGIWHPRTLEIKQEDGMGGYTEQSIINTILCWKNEQLLFGQPAFKLKTKSKPGQNLFSSFKMDLGLDLGPTFPDSVLSRSKGAPYIIETAKDAAGYFFKLLFNGIYDSIKTNNLPTSIECAFSVPASFQDSQRKDLLEAIKFAGISIESSSFIDEPNAAFLSYFYESWKEESGKTFIDALKKSPINVLVYDFGAGTCDISIIKVGYKNGNLLSQNLAISRFTALGGDNIDKAIAEDILYDQIQWTLNDEDFTIPFRLKNEIIIPRLMPIAERLKISMIDWIIRQSIDSVYQIKDQEHTVSDIESTIFKNERAKGFICPKISIQEFKKIMLKFIDEDKEELNGSALLTDPIYDAIEKSHISLEDLFGVLFIGGSCENPFVRSSVMGIMPENVRSMIPFDLRAHVSQGAAIHCLGYHAFKYDFIQPVTSETINIVTTGDNLAPLIKASTSVPSETFEKIFIVPRENQKQIEIPICLSSPDRILDVLKIYSENTSPFIRGESLSICGKINREKMLDVKVFMKGHEVSSSLIFPMSIEPVSPLKEKYLKVLKKFREECVKVGRKNVSDKIIDELIEAAENCNNYQEVIDLYIFKENISKINCATNICYYASKLGDDELCKKWSKIALKRDPDATNLFNYSLKLTSKDEQISYLRKALQKDSEHIPSLIQLGIILNNDEGISLLRKAHRSLTIQLELGYISKDYCRRLCTTSNQLNDTATLKKAEEYLKINFDSDSKFKNKKLYNEENLVAQYDATRLPSRGAYGLDGSMDKLR